MRVICGVVHQPTAAIEPFDLVVVDEAHEVFSAVYKRYDKGGTYQEDSKRAQIAAGVRDVVKEGGSPVLLLTATPIQNSLAELWGLVQYVEPTGALLGRLPTFREVFCDGDRAVHPELALSKVPPTRHRVRAIAHACRRTRDVRGQSGSGPMRKGPPTTIVAGLQVAT